MTDSLNGIINQLERQKTAIDRALLALQGIEGTEAPAPTPATTVPTTRKGGMTPAGRRRLSAALKKRWAAKKAAEVEPAVTPEAPARERRKFSAATRRKMALAQQARWAKNNGEGEPSPPIAEAPKAKRRISAEGMKRIIAATKKRWRLQRAAAKSAQAK
jgi:hypothetical protein